MTKWFFALLLSVVSIHNICEALPNKRLKIVCTFTILADMVKNIAGEENAEVHFLVGPNSDPHVFSPTPKSAEMLARADLVFVNGLGFEGWMERLIDASGYKGNVITTTEGMSFILNIADKESDAKTIDPHTWLTIRQALIYIKNIREALGTQRPTLKATFERNYRAYKAKLRKLEANIRKQIATIPNSKRKVITAHDAFGYFGQEYGINFSAPQGITTESEPSAKNVARLIKMIKEKKIRAVFVENIANERLIRQMAKEANVSIQGILYTDALSEKSGPANSYINLMKHNVNLLVKAMKLNG